jgi:hypothetical protein
LDKSKTPVFFPPDRVYVFSEFFTQSPVWASNVSLYSIEIAGTSIMGTTHYYKIFPTLTPDLGLQTSCSAMTATTPPGCVFSFVLDTSIFYSSGDLLILGVYDVDIAGMRRRSTVQREVKFSSTTTLSGTRETTGHNTSSETTLFAVLGTLIGVIACAVIFIAGVAIYRRRKASAAAASSKKYSELECHA